MKFIIDENNIQGYSLSMSYRLSMNLDDDHGKLLLKLQRHFMDKKERSLPQTEIVRLALTALARQEKVK